MKVIYVVLVYRNYEDLKSFINSLLKFQDNVNNVIVVENFFNTATSKIFEDLCNRYKILDFKRIPNDGYGMGNNFGIDIAKKHNPEYIVVSNPDILVKDFNLEHIEKLPPSVYGPRIIRKNKTDQNPYWSKKSFLSEWLMYLGEKNNNDFIRYIGIILTKIYKLTIRHDRISRVFALHGSFLIFHISVIKTLDRPFDPNIFLYCEEDDLAYTLASKKIKSFYVPLLKVVHMEDGSAGLLKKSTINEFRRKSAIYRFEKWNNRII